MCIPFQAVAADSLNDIKKAAEQGEMVAQYFLGMMYEDGRGVKKDLSEAVKWYRKAAEQGYAPGQYLTGEMYRKGEGVIKDSYEAANWYRKAAEQGYADAQLNLGNMYLQTEDLSEAVKWYKKADEQGLAPAQYNLGLMYYKGKGVQLDKIKAYTLWLKAARQGHEGAQHNLDIFCKECISGKPV